MRRVAPRPHAWQIETALVDHARADLENFSQPVVEEAGETVSVGLVGLGEQPIENTQLLVAQIAGCFDVEAVLRLDPVDLGAEMSAGGVEQAFVGCRREVVASISSQQRHGEVVSGMGRLCQFPPRARLRFRARARTGSEYLPPWIPPVKVAPQNMVCLRGPSGTETVTETGR